MTAPRAGVLGGLPVSRAAVIRALDALILERAGVPSAVLMEHAGGLVARALLARFGARPTVVLCGPGNNGGDGYVIARHLAIAGVPVRAVPVLAPRSADCGLFHGVADRLGLVDGGAAGSLEGAELVVDAIFGTGQRAPLALPEIAGLEAALAAGATLVAVDVPTGVDADTGQRVGAFPTVAHVITIGRLKPCLFAEPVSWECVDIGLPRPGGPWPGGDAALAGREGPGAAPEAWWAERVAVRGFGPGDHKWRRGHVALLAGSAEKAGAAVLACLGALRGGAGLVTLHVEHAAWGRLGALPPEVMVDLPSALPTSRADALVVGPGLGRAEDARVRQLWAEERRPMVVDADGLRALGARPAGASGLRLLTPHAGEASALLDRPWSALEADRLATASALRELGPSIYKGACPIVTGAPHAVLSGGVPSLGTGGSGDVLAGLCGALLARHRPATPEQVEQTALEAAFLHQEAGRAAGPPGVGAREIADRLPEVAERAASTVLHV